MSLSKLVWEIWTSSEGLSIISTAQNELNEGKTSELQQANDFKFLLKPKILFTNRLLRFKTKEREETFFPRYFFNATKRTHFYASFFHQRTSVRMYEVNIWKDFFAVEKRKNVCAGHPIVCFHSTSFTFPPSIPFYSTPFYSIPFRLPRYFYSSLCWMHPEDSIQKCLLIMFKPFLFTFLLLFYQVSMSSSAHYFSIPQTFYISFFWNLLAHSLHKIATFELFSLRFST